MVAPSVVSISTHDNPPAFEAVARKVKKATQLTLTFCAILFCIALGGLTVDIIMRYTVNSSVRGMQEIVNLLFNWIYMLGAAALYARKGDAAITFITRSLPGHLQNALAIFVSILIAASMLIVLVQTCGLMSAQASITSAELGIPEPLRFLPLAIASAGIIATSLIDVWGYVLSARYGFPVTIWRESDEQHDS